MSEAASIAPFEDPACICRAAAAVRRFELDCPVHQFDLERLRDAFVEKEAQARKVVAFYERRLMVGRADRRDTFGERRTERELRAHLDFWNEWLPALAGNLAEIEARIAALHAGGV